MGNIVNFNLTQNRPNKNDYVNMELYRHVHDFYELYIFLNGDNCVLTLENNIFELKKGDIFLIRPMQYHYVNIEKNKEDYSRFIFQFYLDGTDEFVLKYLNNFTYTNFMNDYSLHEIMDRIIKYKKELTNEQFNFLSRGLSNELIVLLNRSASIDPKVKYNPIINKALLYINSNLDKELSLEIVSKDCGVHPNYLSRLFPKVLNINFNNYIRSKRLILAKKMISEGESPTKVFTICGFVDYTNFARSYNSFFGHYPSKDKK